MSALLKERLAAFSALPSLVAEFWKVSPGYCVAIGVLRLISSTIPIAILWVAKITIDLVAHPAQAEGRLQDNVPLLILAEFTLIVGQQLLASISGIITTRVTNRLIVRSSANLVEHAAALDLATLEDPEFQNRLERARSQVRTQFEVVTRLIGFCGKVLQVMLSMTALFLKAPWLLLQCVATFPVLYLELKHSTREYRLYKRQSHDRREADYFFQVGTDSAYAKEVRLFGQGSLIAGWLTDTLTRQYQEDEAQRATRYRDGAMYSVFSSVIYYSIYGILAWRAFHGQYSAGDLVFVAGLMQTCRNEVASILTTSSESLDSMVRLRDLFDVFKSQPRIHVAPNPVPAPRPITQGFEFRNVSFSYPGRDCPALSNVSFRLNRRSCLALVGENGSGKSTIVKLMARLYDPTSGSILLDGVDLRDYEIGDLRKQISAVFQDFSRYQRSVGTNIGVGDPERSDDYVVIEGAARRAGVHDHIWNLPQQYHQMLGKMFSGGVDLSGGQWQKLGIARALMRESQLLILDEPTAALDARTEYELFQHFRELMRDRMSILVTHRFSTVRLADHILVMTNGTISEEGTHRELIKRGGSYAEMYSLQASLYEMESHVQAP